ncbi:hypothetical protein PVAG01_10704 [Phlyctema vagabunda]|uniref:Uncharacterized protein n=1 Tax=Phlyctema vagabunda TaxID=108571 RepID=A0ABR4P310_9HELO
MTSSEHPQILLLSLAFRSFFDETYSSLIDVLGQSARLQRAKTSAGALHYLEANNPRAIIASDEGLTEHANVAVLEKVKAYVQSGGLVIFGLHFPSFTSPTVFDEFFDERFDVPWKSGDYHRTYFAFNPSCKLPTAVERDRFPGQYSMKALHVENAREHEKIFVPVHGALTLSSVFPSTPVDETQAALVGTEVGAGFLVYAGDVNAEEGSDRVIMALCGLSN